MSVNSQANRLWEAIGGYLYLVTSHVLVLPAVIYFSFARPSNYDLYQSNFILTISIMVLSKSDSILIVGAGAFGLSTALHLRTAGYTDITVIDRDHEVPSRYSAANDLNKIVRAEYEDEFYTDLSLVCGCATTINW
jgi:hypothetical protein